MLKLNQETKRIVEEIFSHWASCDLCTSANQTVLDDVNKCQRELEDTLNLARKTGAEMEEYYLLLKSLRSKLTYLKASINHSLPDLVPDQTYGTKTDSPSPQTDEKLGTAENFPSGTSKILASSWKRKEVIWGFDVQSEWLLAQTVYARIKNMERFILMDFDLIRTYQDIQSLCEELSVRNANVNLDILEGEFLSATELSSAKRYAPKTPAYAENTFAWYVSFVSCLICFIKIGMPKFLTKQFTFVFLIHHNCHAQN